MKNLLAYTPETFDNLELENFEYAPLANEIDMEEGFVRGKQSRPRIARVKTMPRRSIASVTRKPSRIPRLPQIPPRQPMRPLLPPRIGAAASLNVFPPADDRRPSGQAGGEGSFANAPAQDISSEHVRWVQETLNRALGLRLIVDGTMNRETRSAVRMFQERKGLPVTGLVGPDTEEALRAEGGQAAAEPELLEGEWEMPDSGECSCGGREMEEFVFEAEPFGGAEFGELESETTPPVATPRVLTYTTKDVIDKRISVPAQHSLVRLSKNPATSADAVGMLQAVKSGQLAGIYCVNWELAAKRAQRLGKTWWTVIPQGENGVLMLDPDNLAFGPPLIAFRRELSPDCGVLKNEKKFLPSIGKLDAALVRIWKSYVRFRKGFIRVCSTGSGINREFESYSDSEKAAPDPVVPTTCITTSTNLIMYASGYPGREQPGRLFNSDFQRVADKSQLPCKDSIGIENLDQFLKTLMTRRPRSISKIFLIGHITSGNYPEFRFGPPRTHGKQLSIDALREQVTTNFINTNRLWNRFSSGAEIIINGCGHDDSFSIERLLDELGNKLRVCVRGFSKSLCIFRPGGQIGIRPSAQQPCPSIPTGDRLEQLSPNLTSCSCCPNCSVEAGIRCQPL